MADGRENTHRLKAPQQEAAEQHCNPQLLPSLSHVTEYFYSTAVKYNLEVFVLYTVSYFVYGE